VLDGPNADGAEIATRNACSQLSASTQNDYISLIATTLVKRLVETLI
jgi:hypothetical protein